MSNLSHVYRFLLTPRWLGWLAVALALATVMTMLGLWQLSRYEQRSEINARIDAADPANPVPLDQLLAAPAPGEAVGPPLASDADWQMVDATGRFDPAHEVLVRARTVSGQVGFEVLTPLVLPDGTALLIDRGWLPPDEGDVLAAPAVPPAATGQVTVVGRLRPSESRARPVTERDSGLQARQIHVESIAPHLPYRLYNAYVQQAEPGDPALTPIPIRRENTWLNAGYAVQWWIFAGMVLVGYGWLARREAHGFRQTTTEPAPLAGQ